MRVYMLDDDEAICRMVRRMAARDGRDVQCFGTPEMFLEALDTLPPGILLLDIGLPGMSGLDLLRRIAGRCPAMPVVMLSGTTEVDHAIAAFRGGAVQFLRKPFDRQALSKALNEASLIAAERHETLERARRAGEIRLSGREREVLAGMTLGEQSKVIAHRLGISIRTVDMHRTNIFAKLAARNAVQAVSIARRLNLVPADPN